MTEPSVIELCAGAGGQSLGLHLAGFRHRLALELDTTAAETLAVNLARLEGRPLEEVKERTVRVGDVADPEVWTPADERNLDLLAGGVPCPPFSTAGKQLGAVDERDLFAWAIEVLGAIRPKALLLENVRGLATSRFAGYREEVASRLDELGYWSEWRLLNACDFGVPQLRPRFVLVALAPEYAPYFDWPDSPSAPLTVGQTLADLMAERGWPGAESWVSAAAGIAPTIVGGSKRHGGPDLGPTRAKRSWAQLGVDGMGVADSAPDVTLPVGHRPRLTCEMVARLQGWDDQEYSWTFCGGKTAKYRQIGNAFPPPVARAVASKIASALAKERALAPHTSNRDEVSKRPSRDAVGQRVVHDPIYRVLRAASVHLSVPQIQFRIGGDLAAAEVERGLERLDADFVLDVRDLSGQREYRLVEFKAFRGEDSHPRRDLFERGRSKAS